MHKPYEYGRVEEASPERAAYHFQGATIFIERKPVGWEARVVVEGQSPAYAWAFTALEAVNAMRDAAGLRTRKRYVGRRTLLPTDAAVARRDAAKTRRRQGRRQGGRREA